MPLPGVIGHTFTAHRGQRSLVPSAHAPSPGEDHLRDACRPCDRPLGDDLHPIWLFLVCAGILSISTILRPWGARSKLTSITAWSARPPFIRPRCPSSRITTVLSQEGSGSRAAHPQSRCAWGLQAAPVNVRAGNPPAVGSLEFSKQRVVSAAIRGSEERIGSLQSL